MNLAYLADLSRKFETIDMWASRYLVAHVIDSWPGGRLTGV